jgi:O-antigen ligase
MEMALPVLMALWAAEVVPARNSKGERVHDHPSRRDVQFAKRLLLSALLTTMVVALLFSRSRAGTACGLVALATASLSLVWNARSPQARGILALVAIAAVALGAYVGLTPVLEHFSPDELVMGYEARAAVGAATVRGALDFLPFGSGLGTYADVFQRYQAGTIPGFVDHAHNDYAEACFELGVAGVIAILILIVAYIQRWRVLGSARLSRRLGYLQVGAGLGMAALAAHGMFDFNFHIPANAFYFAFLAGVFWFTPSEDRA